MKKTLHAFVTVILFVALGFGISPEAKSETAMYQVLPCWKKKGQAYNGAGFLYCPKFIITLSCNYVDDYTFQDDSEDDCNYNPF